jgi:hypothetical protein
MHVVLSLRTGRIRPHPSDHKPVSEGRIHLGRSKQCSDSVGAHIPHWLERVIGQRPEYLDQLAQRSRKRVSRVHSIGAAAPFDESALDERRELAVDTSLFVLTRRTGQIRSQPAAARLRLNEQRLQQAELSPA